MGRKQKFWGTKYDLWSSNLWKFNQIHPWMLNSRMALLFYINQFQSQCARFCLTTVCTTLLDYNCTSRKYERYCIVLYCIVLHCNVLYFTVFYVIVFSRSKANWNLQTDRRTGRQVDRQADLCFGRLRLQTSIMGNVNHKMIRKYEFNRIWDLISVHLFGVWGHKGLE